MRTPVIALAAIVGPTGVGKTEIAIEVAERLGGEIVSADSIQIYRGMTVGSAKPSQTQRERIPHHLIDVADPREPWTVADFQREARDAVRAIAARGRPPVVCGGTGLYLNALLYEMDFSGTSGDPALRQELAEEAASGGNHAIYKRLADLDPVAAERIHPNNVKRVIRAIEIASARHTVPDFRWDLKPAPSFFPILVGLSRDRAELRRRIDARAVDMMENGLVEEVAALLAAGLRPEDPPMLGIGYKEVAAYLAGTCSQEEALEWIRIHSSQYAKRQMTWFRRYEGIRWFDLSGVDGNDGETIIEAIACHIRMALTATG